MIMKNIRLHKPTIDELWFREQCMSDPDTMAYNGGYDVHYEGYHYDSGCIDFPKEKWESWYESKMKNKDFFYAYIFDEDNEKFVGYVNFNKNAVTKKATMGIVIKASEQGQGYMRPAMELLIDKAKECGVKALTDTVPETRENALRVFYSLGFKKVGESVGLKYGEEEIIAEIEKDLI